MDKVSNDLIKSIQGSYDVNDLIESVLNWWNKNKDDPGSNGEPEFITLAKKMKEQSIL